MNSLEKEPAIPKSAADQPGPGRPREPVAPGDPGASYVTALRRWPDEFARTTRAELAGKLGLSRAGVSDLLQNSRTWRATGADESLASEGQ